MAKLQLFTVSGDGEAVFCGSELVGDDLTPKQAKEMARRLNQYAQDTEHEFKPTRREQKFTVHAEVDFDIVSCVDADEFDGYYSVKELTSRVKGACQEMDLQIDCQYGDPKIKVTVVKVYDKQVPNE